MYAIRSYYAVQARLQGMPGIIQGQLHPARPVAPDPRTQADTVPGMRAQCLLDDRCVFRRMTQQQLRGSLPPEIILGYEGGQHFPRVRFQRGSGEEHIIAEVAPTPHEEYLHTGHSLADNTGQDIQIAMFTADVLPSYNFV